MSMFHRILFALTGMLLLCMASTVRAEGHNYGPYPSYYSEECGGCHIPYPAQLMTQAGWETQIKGLKNHFGKDASVDVPASQTILSYLVNNAAWQPQFASTDSAAQLTKTEWFIRKHGKTTPKDKVFGECAQCHAQAAQGDYDKDRLTVPADWQRIR